MSKADSKDPASVIPDELLKDVYMKTCKEFDLYRERLTNSTPAIEHVKVLLGYEYAHIPPDAIRDRITSRCKRGGWAVKRPKAAFVPESSPDWYAEYLKSDRWQAIRKLAVKRDGGRCRVCNSNERLEVHHRSYEFCNRGEIEHELDDVTTLCRKCHRHYHTQENGGGDSAVL